MKGVSLTLALIVAFNLANPCFSQTCDVFDQITEECISLPTSRFCGTPSITREQIRQIEAATEIIDMIEQIGGPIFEGSPQAQQLGISVESPIVDLTFRQENFYRRCFNSNSSSPASEEFRRKKRQTQASNPPSCCSPSPNTVRVLATVDGNGRAVNVVQTPAMSQLFQDTDSCQGKSCTGGFTCGPVRLLVRAEVVTLRNPNIGSTNIVVNICGAVSTSSAG